MYMRLLDEEHTEHPFYGVERMHHWLTQKGYKINIKRVRRLLRQMGLEAFYAKPRLSQPGITTSYHPYLLHGIKITTPDTAWATDITYIRLNGGYCYLCVIMDWASRYIIAWRLSGSLEKEHSLEVLEEALTKGRTPWCLNSDQGSQFTNQEYVNRLLEAGVKPSWDGKGRWMDNVFVERLWRSIKWECVYLYEWETLKEARAEIGRYITFYNHERGHRSLDKQPPAAVYFGYPTKP